MQSQKNKSRLKTWISRWIVVGLEQIVLDTRIDERQILQVDADKRHTWWLNGV